MHVDVLIFNKNENFMSYKFVQMNLQQTKKIQKSSKITSHNFLINLQKGESLLSSSFIYRLQCQRKFLMIFLSVFSSLFREINETC